MFFSSIDCIYSYIQLLAASLFNKFSVSVSGFPFLIWSGLAPAGFATVESSATIIFSNI